jgi:DNA replication protein DnaD
MQHTDRQTRTDVPVKHKTNGSKLNVYIKTHKENKPIRPIVNNTHVPAYKTVKYLNKKLNSLINLPLTTKNAQEVAEELKTIHFGEHMKIITPDIKDLYVNLPIQGILQTTKFWLNKHNTSTTIEQILQLLETILKQNYFQYNNQLFRPDKGIAMGPPISSTIAEI